jgi:addiction module RelE/StbE family toxin
LKLTWKPLALYDREQIMDYIAQDNPNAALALDTLFEERADKLPERHQLYRIGRMPGTREMVVHPNYILVYRVEKDMIEVLRVLHAAQQWPEKI